MQKLLRFVLSLFLCGITAHLFAQSETEKLDLPGDNLNLYAVMKLFQESKTLEAFERSLNAQQAGINNLDLNGDEGTDYIRVSDKVSGDIHTITLKTAVSENEDQNIAVFFIEKKSDGKVLIQLVGDEDLYGKDYILEPNNTETANPGYTGLETVKSAQSNPVSVATWPMVRYVFSPGYSAWNSPWRWRYYPSYWKPWRPRYWHSYYGYHYHLHKSYNARYRKWKYFRNPAWYGQYYSANFRSRSIIVRTKSNRGDYKTTYSRPATAGEGSALFVKRNPKSRSVSYRVPAFDKNGRPVIVKQVEPARPAKKPVKRKKPGHSRKKPASTKGLTKPSSRESVKPATPASSREPKKEIR
ncbi:hypothetical protein [Dyadobacter sp. CY343]|uniref:hypothetical protein n=1 Tax=Dyadobacter sp. CY343 TaxID=2907299 RepID=UPI001F4466CB|nr:hypothetical protein [Dyadobacter sp. CY343]MCE7060888.1 hypothetical protein [Dyadobacter sp. CY343]